MGRRYGLIGKPVEHSLSPRLHEIIGTGDYRLIEAEPQDLEHVLADRRIDGFNVTIPYKQAVIPMLDELSEEARAVGAVNTILRKDDGTLKGFNTDVFGCRRLFRRGAVEGRKVLILGTGGASLAAAEAVRLEGASEVLRVSRAPDPEDSSMIGYDDLRRHRDAEIIINATPVGMNPDNGHSPLDGKGPRGGSFDLHNMGQLEIAADLIYDPHRTKFLLDAEDAGADIISGLTTLVWQGIMAREIWHRTGRSAREVQKKCRDEAEEALGELLRAQLNVVTVGMPGSGKSSISRQVAKKMGRKFVDIDSVIAASEGRTAAEIIVESGELEFRDIEEETVRSMVSRSGLVIATGGGSVLRRRNRELMKENSAVVYIKRPIRMLSKRNRPLSKKYGLRELHRKRAPLYAKASDISVYNAKDFGRYRPYMRDIRDFASEIINSFNAYVDEQIKHDATGAGRDPDGGRGSEHGREEKKRRSRRTKKTR
jgi:shikimate dehydrogenase